MSVATRLLPGVSNNSPLIFPKKKQNCFLGKAKEAWISAAQRSPVFVSVVKRSPSVMWSSALHPSENSFVKLR